jgi:translation elongation factor EF-1beta
MEPNNPARYVDSRDARTLAGEAAHPTEPRDTPNDVVVQASPSDPVNVVNTAAIPSRYSQRDIDTGSTPLNEVIDRLIDPSIGREELSTNSDVLNLDASWFVEGEEPDFMGDFGTSDIIEAIEEGEPYFPPTDPPLTTRGAENNVSVLGGFSGTSLQEDEPDQFDPVRVKSGDDQIAQRVSYALATDAYTAELDVEVEVADGVAHLYGKVVSLDDIGQAEQVAGSVQGVEEVDEELEIV